MSDIRLLYVEDEPALSRIVSESLQSRGFEVTTVDNGQTAIDTFQKDKFDIGVLDIMLPKVDGYTVAKELRKEDPNFPIIFLTAKTQTKDVLQGFDLGGRDYIRKPFSMEELIVRIHNIIEHDQSNGQNYNNKAQVERFEFGAYTFDPNRYELTFQEQVITLSEREASLLHILCLHMNQTCDRKEVLMKIWKDDSYYNSRNLDVYINKLRKLLARDSTVEIVTLKGVGYVFKV